MQLWVEEKLMEKADKQRNRSVGTLCRAEMLLGLRQSEGEDKRERETLHSG